MALFLLAVLAAGLADASAVKAHGDHPAVKIIALLAKLQAQVKSEGEAEAAAYAKFQYWCTDLTSAKQKIIKEESEKMAVASTDIEALEADIDTLKTEISELGTQISTDETAKTEASNQRTTANGEFLAAKSDLDGTIAAVGSALSSLQGAGSAVSFLKKSARDDVKKALAFVDVYASAEQAKKVHAFLQETAANATAYENRDGRVAKYDFKSGGVVEILKQLKLKFEDELEQAEREETEAQNAWLLADAAAEDTINAATTAKTTKESLKGVKGQDLSTANGDLTDATNARNSAQTVFDDTTQNCKTRADEWDERSSRRQGEIDAMQQAIEVLEKITGTRAPADKGVDVDYTGFLQKAQDPIAQVVNLLRKASTTKATKELASLADAIAKAQEQPRGTGTFDQIKNMIQKMIFHLMSEQTDEDKHKKWCDNELQKTNQMKTDKETKRDSLQADINSLTAEISNLNAAIVGNEQDIANTEASIETSTAQRQEDKAENAATVKDAQEAQTAVASAIAVLTDFYKSTGAVDKEVWEAFVQTKAVRRASNSQEPQLWTGGESGRYGATSGGVGVIGMLEDIASDFATMEAEAKADETTQQDQYDSSLTANKVLVAEKKQDTDMKKARVETLTEKLNGKQADHDHNAKELEATTQYLTDLNPACVTGDSSYDERKAARTSEITALKQAQDILEKAFDDEVSEYQF